MNKNSMNAVPERADKAINRKQYSCPNSPKCSLFVGNMSVFSSTVLLRPSSHLALSHREVLNQFFTSSLDKFIKENLKKKKKIEKGGILWTLYGK